MYVYLKVAKRIDLKNFFSQGKKKLYLCMVMDGLPRWH